MAYINWFSIEDIYAGTTIKDTNKKQNNNLALHTTDDSEAVIENRKALAEELGIKLEQCVFANQTHSDHIHKVVKDDIGAGAFSVKDAIQDCDAFYTNEKNVLLGVFTADCVPILIYDKEQHIIASIHAGWQGTAKGICKKMIDTLIYEEDSNPEELYAYIGPSIEFVNYEVSKDVVDELKQLSINTEPYILEKDNGKYLVDLKGVNQQIMLDAGIADTNIFMHHGDTFEDDENFFSYRRDKDSGRLLTFILQK